MKSALPLRKPMKQINENGYRLICGREVRKWRLFHAAQAKVPPGEKNPYSIDIVAAVVGISKSQLSRIERGETAINMDVWDKLRKALPGLPKLAELIPEHAFPGNVIVPVANPLKVRIALDALERAPKADAKGGRP